MSNNIDGILLELTCWIFLLLLVPLFSPASVFGDEADPDGLILVEGGVSLAPVVVFEDAPRFTRQAAGELAEYIEKVSDALPEVIEGKPDPIPETAIWVGYQPVLMELFPDADLEFEHAEEILISANQDHLLIAGRDRWDTFHETNPGYFALQPDGTRGGGDKPYPAARTVKMCKSNPDLWEQWIRTNVEEELEKDHTRTIFNAAANDSWASGYCVCENCLAWDHPDAEKRRFSWSGYSQDYVAMSDRQVTFANNLARKLKERYPEEDYFVGILAYGHSRPVPVEATPAENVIVTSVANFFTSSGATDRGSPNDTLHRDQFKGWGEVAPNIIWRPNKTRRMASMPNIPPRQTIDDFRFAAENNSIGVRIDMIWEHWSTRGPLYYVMAQMAWNPWQDGEAMLEDYYRRGFGKAAEHISAYWGLMEEKSEESLSATTPLDYPDLFDEEIKICANSKRRWLDVAPWHRAHICTI